jgi:hypothetical protein
MLVDAFKKTVLALFFGGLIGFGGLGRDIHDGLTLACEGSPFGMLPASDQTSLRCSG